MGMVPFTQRERELLRQLTSLVAQRAHVEAEVEERVKESTRLIQRRFDKDAKQADAAHAKEVADSASELAERIAKVKAKAADEIAVAKKAMDVQVSAHNAKTNSLWSAAKRKWDEAMWLADTVVESGGSKIRNQYELAKRALTPKVQDIERIRAAAADLLARHGHEPLPAAPSDAPSEGSPTPLQELSAKFTEARAEAVQRLHLLHSRVRPVWVRWPLVLLVVGLAGVGGAAIRVGWPLPKPIPWSDAGVAALGSMIGAGVLMLVLRILLRRRVPRTSKAMAEALDRAKYLGDESLRAAVRQRDDDLAALQARRDADLNKAKADLATAKAEVDERVQESGPRLKREHEVGIEAIQKKLAMTEQALEDEHRQHTIAANWRRDQSVQLASNVRDKALRELGEDADSELGRAEAAWKQGLDAVSQEYQSILTSPEGMPPVWLRREDFTPPTGVPMAVRFGRVMVDAAALPGGLSSNPRMKPDVSTLLELPAFLDLADKASLLVQSGRDAREACIEVLRAVMSRLLTMFPPGKARFTIIDPIGLGRSFAGFMHLADHDAALVSDRIWTDPKHIEQKLTDLTEHMENVIQKYLRNEYSTIQEYNAQAGEVAEPYRFLVIADFPANLTENAAKRLWSIITSGPRCGVYTLIAESSDRQVPAWVPLADLERNSVRLVRRAYGFIWQDSDFSAWPLAIDPAPDDETLTRLLNTVGSLSKDATRVQVPFEMVAPPGEIWTGDASEELRLPLGRAGAKKLQYLTIGRGTTQHALIAGRTGSGKSTLLHVIITNLALWYSPDEVELYLVDFKKGVEFKTYATHHLPHARVVAVESEREFGLSVLRRLDAELTRRGALFRDAGVQDLAGFRRSKAAQVMPRVLLIVDEFQEFFVEDDKIAQEASLLMDRLVRQGRAFGMHVILGSQTLGGAYSIARATIGQMAIRIALQCSESDSYLIMSEDNAAARLLSRPGEAIYNDASGLMEGNSPFQIVWLHENKREKYLQRIHDELAITHRAEPPAAVVFEGNIPAQLASNHLLAKLLASGPESGMPARAWLGDAISIKDPTAAIFQRQSGSHMIIVGQQEDSAMAMMIGSALALAAHKTTTARPRLVFLDGSPSEPGHPSQLEQLAAKLPNAAVATPRTIGPAISEVYSILEQRTAADATHAEPVYLFIYALHRFRDLRRSDDYSFSSGDDAVKTPAQQFAAIIREGPSVGIHIIAWTDTVANVERTLERASLREFDSRVLFQMSATDSTHLIDAPTASTLGRHRALLYREQLGVPEKFRPYAMPDPEWLNSVIAQIASGASAVTPSGAPATSAT